MCGIPSSGKTTRALQIKQYFQEKSKVVDLINEEFLGFNKTEYYKDSNNEKILRGSLRSNVEKHLDTETVVICDSLNYIKGF